MSANRDRCAGGRLRKAIRDDLDRCFEIRESVCENRLDDPYEVFIEIGRQVIDEGLCWVWEEAGEVQVFGSKAGASLATLSPQRIRIWPLYPGAV